MQYNVDYLAPQPRENKVGFEPTSYYLRAHCCDPQALLLIGLFDST